MTEQSSNQKNALFQTVSQQDKTEEYPIRGRSETVLLKDQGTTLDKQIDITTTLRARDYKGFGNQSMNGVIEWK